jgi:IS1 transposase
MESMIQETRTDTCRACGSANSVSNGTNRCGNAHYHGKDGGTSRVLKPKQASSEAEKAMVLRAGLERCSLRGVERIFDLPRQTVPGWRATPLQKRPQGKDVLLPASGDDVLELDEIWSLVRKKDHPRWLWAALCRRTRQSVAFVMGDRRNATCQRFWMAIPDGYQPCQTDHVIVRSPLGTFSRKPPIMVSQKKLGRPRIESAGTRQYVSEWVVTFDTRSPFPHLMLFMRHSRSGLLLSIIEVYHLLSHHYLNSRQNFFDREGVSRNLCYLSA